MMTLHLSHKENEKCECKNYVVIMSKLKFKNRPSSNEKFKNKMY